MAGSQAQAAAGTERGKLLLVAALQPVRKCCRPPCGVGSAVRCTEAASPHESWGAAIRVCMAAQSMNSGRRHLIVTSGGQQTAAEEMRAAQIAVAGKQCCQRHQHGARHAPSQMLVRLRRLQQEWGGCSGETTHKVARGPNCLP